MAVWDAIIFWGTEDKKQKIGILLVLVLIRIKMKMLYVLLDKRKGTW